MVKLTEHIIRYEKEIISKNYPPLYLAIKQDRFELDLRDYISAQVRLVGLLRDDLEEINIGIVDSYLEGRNDREESYINIKTLLGEAIRSKDLPKESLTSIVLMG